MASKYFGDDARRPVPIYEFEAEDAPLDANGKVLQPNVMYIKPYMDADTDEAVKREYMSAMIMTRGEFTGEVRPDKMQTALFVHNVVRWEGPDLDGYPCNLENKRGFPVNDPFRQKVIAAINERNSPPETNEVGADGQKKATAKPSATRGNATLTEQLTRRPASTASGSSLPDVLHGRLIKLVD